MSMLKSNEQNEKETKKWTNEEKEKLIALYPYKTTKELCDILNKTEGQVRGMKERLGLNQKHKDLTNEEKQKIIEFYKSNPNDIDLDSFAELIHRPKTSICRFAKVLGLTKNNRCMSVQAYENNQKGFMTYLNSEYYKDIVYPKQVELLTYYAQNKHPQGMLGKHHTEETKQQMSVSHIELFRNITQEEKHNIAMKSVETRRKNNKINTTSNAYSRCHGGTRLDLNCYFRSSWEANIARLLNYFNVQWIYEYKRFDFESEESGVLSYQPDFYLPQYDKWIEVKGWMDEKSKKRLDLFNKHYPKEFDRLYLIDETKYKDINNEYKLIIPNWE